MNFAGVPSNQVCCPLLYCHHDNTRTSQLDTDFLGLMLNPCGNFSDTSSVKSRQAKGSIGHAFTVCIRTENQNQMSFYPFVLHEISVLVELILGHLRYLLTDVPPQPNSPPDNVFHLDHHRSDLDLEEGTESRLQVME